MSSPGLDESLTGPGLRGGTVVFWTFKRLLDLVLGILLLPVVGAIALMLLLLNPFFNNGKVFYVQPRIGFKGRVFRMIKFRTMISAKPDLPHAFATSDIQRITPLGSFLREKRIDETPQVFNILAGHMSFIGPRPEQMQFAEEFSKKIQGFKLRHNVRPGISGLAQVEIGYADSVEKTRKKVELDLEYIKRAGWRLEYQIIKKTLKVVVSGFGAV